MKRELRVIEYTKSADEIKRGCSDLLSKGYRIVDSGIFYGFDGKKRVAITFERGLFDLIVSLWRNFKCLNQFCRI